jgi:predicted RNA-binding protein associated with RNAse of E/G family
MGHMAANYPVPVPIARRDDTHHEVHPPKVELFDVAAMTNTDPKGFVRAVDEYRHTDHGLLMARPVDGHRRIAYFESLLLPELGLRVSKWRGKRGHDLGHDFYIDIVDITDGPVWRTVDLYLDVLVRTGRDLRVEDTDELLAALGARLIDVSAGQRALERTHRTVDGVARHGYDVDAWLHSLGIATIWRTH